MTTKPTAKTSKPGAADAIGPKADKVGLPAAPMAGEPVKDLIKVTATLLTPVDTDENLVAQFKRYIDLKDKLLEDTDYIWSVRWVVGDQEDSKFFKKRAQAEKWADGLKKKGIEAELEKKIKKSGCMKLGKAFGISDWPVEETLDRANGTAYYKVRAEAPNGQYKERTGACDRAEKGKGKAPFDTVMATALTRAADRAIMALIGGETTAEEFEGVGDDTPTSTPPKSDPAPGTGTKGDAVTKCPRCGSVYGGAHRGVLGLCPACMETPCCFICGLSVLPVQDGVPAQSLTDLPPAYCFKCDKLTPEEKERLVQLNQHFTDKKPAKQETERGQHNKRLWAAAGALYGNDAEAKVAATVKQRYQKDSVKDLTDDQFKELAVGVEAYAKKQGKL